MTNSMPHLGHLVTSPLRRVPHSGHSKSNSVSSLPLSWPSPAKVSPFHLSINNEVFIGDLRPRPYCESALSSMAVIHIESPVGSVDSQIRPISRLEWRSTSARGP